MGLHDSGKQIASMVASGRMQDYGIAQGGPAIANQVAERAVSQYAMQG
jgi:hypothetical protein